MLAIEANFLKRIHEIRETALAIDNLKRLAAAKPAWDLAEAAHVEATNLQGMLTASRMWEFILIDGLIINLATAYEEAIEGFIDRGVGEIATKVAAYSKLPPAMQRQHLTGFGQMLSKHTRRKYQHVSWPSAAATFSGALFHTTGSLQVLSDAFTVRENNLKSDVLSEMMKNLGLTGLTVSLSRDPSFQSHLGSTDQRVAKTLIESKIDNFMELRNMVAHSQGSHSHGTYPSTAKVQEHLDFFENLLPAIRRALESHVVSL